MYDFNFESDRRGSDSLKWDVAENELPMWVADMDFKTCPRIIEALHRRVEHGIYGYTIVPDRWYEAIINWWKRRHGLKIQKEWLQFTTGVVPAISSIVKRVTNVGDNILVLTPVYDIFFHSIENFGRHTAECKLSYDGFGYSIDFIELERQLADPLTTMMILCNPHNPVGKVWNKKELKKIGELCGRYGVTVVSDEIHCDLTLPGTDYIPFASVSGECADLSITCIAASKAFNMGGLQSAAVMIPNPVLRNKVVRGLNSDEVAEPNCFAIESTVAAFDYGEQWLNELRDYIAGNIKTAKDFLNHLPEVHLVESEATYLLWIDLRRVTRSSTDFCDFLRKTTGLYLSDGNQYRGGSNTFVRMNIACLRARLDDGLNRLETGIKEYKKFKYADKIAVLKEAKR